MHSLLVTGGCGFVGSSLALQFRELYPDMPIVCLDNLKRRGSELNIPRLEKAHIRFVHGDIRNQEDIFAAGEHDVVLECSAEPSVLAGYGESPSYLIQTNLQGTLNCLEYARIHNATFVFLSTSRVYPLKNINSLPYIQAPTRFAPDPDARIPGFSSLGISEAFSLSGCRSLYGATKLASEVIIQEYVEMYNLNAVVNRCGVLTGAWQFGKIDQGVIVLWLAKHYWKKPLSYIGYGGTGKQVRDILHVEDLFRLLCLQLDNTSLCSGHTFNVGGGVQLSISLCELTQYCEKITGNNISISSVAENRSADIPYYVSDITKASTTFNWKPVRTIPDILQEIHTWIDRNATQLERILA